MPEEANVSVYAENRDSRFVRSERKLTSGAYLITGEVYMHKVQWRICEDMQTKRVSGKISTGYSGILR